MIMIIHSFAEPQSKSDEKELVSCWRYAAQSAQECVFGVFGSCAMFFYFQPIANRIIIYVLMFFWCLQCMLFDICVV